MLLSTSVSTQVPQSFGSPQMIYKHDYKGRAKAILSDAYIFEAINLDVVEPSSHFYTNQAAWDTGAEITMISHRVVDSLHLKPISKTTIMGIGGDEEVEVFRIHVGLPNDFLYEDLTVYCGDIDDYDLLIGMDLISQSDFFLTLIEGNNRFCFQIPAMGEI